MPILGFAEIAEKLRRSTVNISAGRRAQGSGVIVKPEGVIVTNAHVAAFSPVELELWDGSRVQGILSVRDESRDVAVLQVPLSDLPAAPLGDSNELRVGELVIAVGNPLGFMGALSTGVVHAVGRMPGLGLTQWVQTNVRLAPGNSGGPLANAKGHVVGINTMVAGGVGLAIPGNTVSRLLKGKGSTAPLGIVSRAVQIAARGRAQLGLLILEIAKNSTAEAASLMLGDIIIGVDGRILESLEDIERVLDGTSERVVRFQFLRGDRSHIRTVAVRLGLKVVAAA